MTIKWIRYADLQLHGYDPHAPQAFCFSWCKSDGIRSLDIAWVQLSVNAD